MGTRGMLGFFHNGETRGCYNHYDSYPSGVGVQVLKEIKEYMEQFKTGIKYGRKEYDMDKCKLDLLASFLNIRLIKNEPKPTQEEVEKYSAFFGERGSNLVGHGHTKDEWYALLRDVQGTLKPYLSRKLDIMLNGSDFIKNDSLFCEWAYVVNIDDLILEVWVGFQNRPQKGNRYGEEPTYEPDYSDSIYYPCALLATFSLDALPNNDRFVGLLEGMKYGVGESKEGIEPYEGNIYYAEKFEEELA